MYSTLWSILRPPHSFSMIRIDAELASLLLRTELKIGCTYDRKVEM